MRNKEKVEGDKICKMSTGGTLPSNVNKKGVRNCAIDVYKFVFSLIILLLHYYQYSASHLPGGGIGVEFYVMTAALFFFQKLERTENGAPDERIDNIAYIKLRFMRFFPYTTVALLISILVRRFYIPISRGTELTLTKMYNWFARDIWDVLLVSLTGINDGSIMLNEPLWTVSAMLICEFIIWGLYQHNKKAFRTLIAPIAIMFVLSYWKNVEGKADSLAWIGFTTFGTMRLFSSYSLALFIYEMSKKLRQMSDQLTQKARFLLTAFEFGCLAISIVNMEFSASRYFRFVNILLFCIVLTIAFSGQSYSSKVSSRNKLCVYLGELSFAIYLVHYPVFDIYRAFYPEVEVLESHVLDFLAVVLVLSVIFDYFMKKLLKVTAFISMRVKQNLIISVPE